MATQIGQNMLRYKYSKQYNFLLLSVVLFVEVSWDVMAHAQKPDFVFRRNGRVQLSRQGSQFSRLLAAEVCASAVAMLDTPCSEVVWRVLATHSIRQFPLHFPSRASPCAITFQLDSTSYFITGKAEPVDEKLRYKTGYDMKEEWTTGCQK